MPGVAALEEAAGYAEHHGRGEAVVRPPTHRAHVVDLLRRRLRIFAELDFRNGHQPRERHADGAAHDSLLIEGGVEHPFAAELLLKSERHRMDTALGPDVLTEDQ